MRTWRTSSARETRELGERLAPELLPDRCLLLFGDLGAGKTVLAQGVAGGLGIDPAEVQSPTFALLREHLPAAGRGPGGRLSHLDLYRLKPADAIDCGFEEVLLGPGVKVVEWAERLPFEVPGALCLAIREGSGGEREIEEIESPPRAVE